MANYQFDNISKQDIQALSTGQIRELTAEDIQRIKIPSIGIGQLNVNTQIMSNLGETLYGGYERLPFVYLDKCVWLKDRDELFLDKDVIDINSFLYSPAILVVNSSTNSRVLYIPIDEDDSRFLKDSKGSALYYKATKKTNKANYLRIE